MPAGGVFGAASTWKADISSAPLAPDSAVQVKALGEALARHYGVAAFNVYQYNVAWYTVPADQKTTTVGFYNCQNKPDTPPGLYGPGGQFEKVPIPDSATPTRGTDATLTIYRPDSDTLWDLWKVRHDKQGWRACWGGRIDRVSQSSGAFTGSFGASASGLAYEGGAISVADARSGSIDHALALGVPFEVVSDKISWPATRSDGENTSVGSISEGQRLRLDPAVDVDKLGLSAIASMVAKAAQRYGLIVTDKSGALGFAAEDGALVTERTGTNPWSRLMQGRKSYEIFRGFPWNRMQVLPLDYGEPSG